MNSQLSEPHAAKPKADPTSVEIAASESEALLKDLAEQKDLHQRLAADFDNFKRPNRQESDARTAPISERFFQLKVCCKTGICPRGAYVRARVGRVLNPLSSIKTMVRGYAFMVFNFSA